jgi:hypothetical protein
LIALWVRHHPLTFGHVVQESISSLPLATPQFAAPIQQFREKRFISIVPRRMQRLVAESLARFGGISPAFCDWRRSRVVSVKSSNRG